MTPDEYYEHFSLRAKQRYDWEISRSDWELLNDMLKCQHPCAILIAHNRDGEVWYVKQNLLTSREVFVVFDKDMAVTCLPCNKKMNSIRDRILTKIKKGKPTPKRLLHDEENMFFRHCYYSMMDYYSYELTYEEWCDWNQKAVNNQIVWLQTNNGVKFGKLQQGDRMLVVSYTRTKVLDVKQITPFWERKIQKSSASTGNIANILSNKIKQYNVSFQ